MANKYPDPYPIETEWRLARARAWVHFRDREKLDVLDQSGKPGQIPVKTGDSVMHDVRSLVEFVFFDPSRINRVQPATPHPTPNTPPKKPQKAPKTPPAWPPNVSPKLPNQPGGNMQNNTNQLPPQRQKEYIPQDMKKNIESKETADGYWQIEPPLDGYYYSTVDSYYDPLSMLWSTRENYIVYNPTLSPHGKRHRFYWVAGPGTMSLPLPRGCQIDMSTWQVAGALIEDQNGCIAVKTNQVTQIDFEFVTQQTFKDIWPIHEDSKYIIGWKWLTYKTNEVISELQKVRKSKFDVAIALCDYIKTSKKYNVEYQAHIHRTSTTNDYFYNLDESQVLECFSANALFVGIARMLGVPARMCGWHVPKTKNKKSHISNSTGHAWSEIWDGNKWIRTDATPVEQDDHIVEDAERKEKEENEKMEEQGFDPNNPNDIKNYELYKRIEVSVQPQIRRLIKELESILPKDEVANTEGWYRTGELDGSKLIDWRIRWDTRIFERTILEEIDPVMRLCEVIIIDKSWSMYMDKLIDPALQAAIVRAEVLWHFWVPTCIIFFSEKNEMVMTWEWSVWGKLKGAKNPKKTHGAPARIISSAMNQGAWTNISLPLELTKRELDTFLQSPDGRGRTWSITFIGDGAPSPWQGLSGTALLNYVSWLNKEYPITAYYLWPEHKSNDLKYYFGYKDTVVVPDVKELPKKMANQFKRRLIKELRKR